MRPLFPDGRGLGGAEVKFWANVSMWGRPLAKSTDATGCSTFEVRFPLARPPRMLTIRFSARANAYDLHGVSWRGEARVTRRLNARVSPLEIDPLFVGLVRAPTEIAHLGLGARLQTELAATELGQLLLDDVLELRNALESSLPVSSLSLVGKVLDGFLKFKGDAEGWWAPSLDDLPLGPLLREQLVKKAIEAHLPSGEIDRLRGSAVWTRNVAAHQKYAPVTLQDSLASAGVVLRAMNLWTQTGAISRGEASRMARPSPPTVIPHVGNPLTGC